MRAQTIVRRFIVTSFSMQCVRCILRFFPGSILIFKGYETNRVLKDRLACAAALLRCDIARASAAKVRPCVRRRRILSSDKRALGFRLCAVVIAPTLLRTAAMTKTASVSNQPSYATRAERRASTDRDRCHRVCGSSPTSTWTDLAAARGVQPSKYAQRAQCLVDVGAHADEDPVTLATEAAYSDAA